MSRHRDPDMVTDDVVRALVTEQYPDLANEEIGRHYRMGHMVAVRVGDRHGVMVPLREDLDPYFARVADLIGPYLPTWDFPLSAPLFSGAPTADLPHHWLVKSWVEASNAGFVALNATAAAPLGHMLAQIHADAPPDAPDNPRTAAGIDAMDRTWGTMLAHAREQSSPSGQRVRADIIDALWTNALTAQRKPRRVWTHGNIQPRSVLSDQGAFAGVGWWYHWGAGDACVDVGSALMLIPTDAREDLMSAYGLTTASDWALAQGCELWCMLRALQSPDPFDHATAWRRLDELDLTQ